MNAKSLALAASAAVILASCSIGKPIPEFSLPLLGQEEVIVTQDDIDAGNWRRDPISIFSAGPYYGAGNRQALRLAFAYDRVKQIALSAATAHKDQKVSRSQWSALSFVLNSD